MRPDPYKRARSRQYKAKHGISDHNKAADQSKDFRSSIIDEKYIYSKESNNNIISSDGNIFLYSKALILFKNYSRNN